MNISSLLFGKLVAQTPSNLTLNVETETNGQSRIDIETDKADFSSPYAPSYLFWMPDEQERLKIGAPKPLWTKEYIGTDKAFYKAGYRWGVSMGNSHEAFKQSDLYSPDGGINLPNGRYMIVIKTDESGNVSDVVIGQQDRGIDKRVIEAFKSGEKPVTNSGKEILDVSNHSMLVSRGNPFDIEKSNHQDYSSVFAGEIGVVNNKISFINDQSGQFFGPNGLVAPTADPENITKEAKVMKQDDYDQIKSNALFYAKNALEDITGQSDINIVKVEFLVDGLSEDEFRQTRSVTLDDSMAASVEACLKQPSVQALFDAFAHEPDKQLRLIESLSKNGDQQRAIFALTAQLENNGTLKDVQAQKLALELFETPEAIGLYLPESDLYIEKVSENSKRKLLASYNKMPQDERPDFPAFVRDLKNHPAFVSFLVGRRVSGGFLKATVAQLDVASKIAGKVMSLFNKPVKLPDYMMPELGEDTRYLHNLTRAGKEIKAITEAVKKDASGEMDVILNNDPFRGFHNANSESLHKNIKALKKLQANGVDVYRRNKAFPEEALSYMTNLYAHAFPPTNANHARLQQEMNTLLKTYDIDTSELFAYVQKRFANRWSNDQIIAGYATESKPFRQLVNDLSWFQNLKEHPAAG